MRIVNMGKDEITVIKTRVACIAIIPNGDVVVRFSEREIKSYIADFLYYNSNYSDDFSTEYLKDVTVGESMISKGSLVNQNFNLNFTFKSSKLKRWFIDLSRFFYNLAEQQRW